MQLPAPLPPSSSGASLEFLHKRKLENAAGRSIESNQLEWMESLGSMLQLLTKVTGEFDASTSAGTSTSTCLFLLLPLPCLASSTSTVVESKTYTSLGLDLDHHHDYDWVKKLVKETYPILTYNTEHNHPDLVSLRYFGFLFSDSPSEYFNAPFLLSQGTYIPAN